MALITGEERVEVPHEPGNFFTLRKLGSAPLQEARFIQTKRQMAVMSTLIDTEMGAEAFEAGTAEAKRQADAGEGDELGSGGNPRNAKAYDAQTLLRAAIKSWEGELYPVPTTAKHIATLDDRTVDWAVARVIEISVPAAETSAERLPGSPPSVSASK